MTMTTTTPPAPAPVTGEGRRTRRGPRGLTWLTLRLHRWAAVCWGLLVLGAAGALLWAAGPGVDAAWADYHTEKCWDNGMTSVDCDFEAPAMDPYRTAVTIGSSLLALMPLLAALWAGAALIGRELENGTAQLAWTQSLTPARWLAAKLTIPAAVLTAGAALLVLLHRTMWSAHLARGGGPWYWPEYTDEFFAGNGPLAVGRVLLGLAVGVLVGLLTRRSLPALGYAFFAMAGLLYAIEELRPHLWPPITVTAAVEKGHAAFVGLPVEEGAFTADGTRIPNPCETPAGCDGVPDLAGYYSDYHPSSHFWPLHLVETAIVLALTAVLMWAAFRVLRRRAGGDMAPHKGGSS
ncbi:ABC transporter permease [Streptomyces sp. MB09-02B]|uniref:ABC transporter permease n=1 Tax=Streptomyces sp. MB09-02B TaxID=3028667 RepID=UPI0029A72A47|nr:ABC transporter permease [Streptomyces sp. MB09-02B]MDX3643977.1 ABC transporter permease [Streptomyces sp. MB09-02B]